MQHFEAFLLTFRLDAMAQHGLVARFMCSIFESEAATQVWLLQRPSGENARYLGYILLSVAAIHAESVQFHQFAAVVFVKSVALAFGLVRLPVIPDAPLPVIIGSLGNAVGDVGVRSTLSQLSR